MSVGGDVSTGRDLSLDWLRGALVLVMVCHHGIEYFDRIDSPLLRYLDFVTGAFVFVALFISGQLARQQGREVASRARRGIWRGLRLIALFSVVNLLIHSVLKTNYNGAKVGVERFAGQLGSIYLVGNKKAASFEILLPIAYAGLIAICLSFVRHRRIAVLGVVLLGVVFCMVQEQSFNVFYTTIGLFAYEVGRTVRVNSWASLYASGWGRLCAVVAVLVYVPVATIRGDDDIMTYSLVVMAACFLLQGAASWAVSGGRRPVWLPLVGRYSLFAYLFHIGVLQLLVRLAPGVQRGAVTGLIVSGGMFIVVLATVVAVERGRSRLRLVDSAYRAVFA